MNNSNAASSSISPTDQLVTDVCQHAEDWTVHREQLLIKINFLETEIKYWKEKVDYLTLKKYGSSSEIIDCNQLLIDFGSISSKELSEKAASLLEESKKTTTIKEHERKTRGQKTPSIPDNIERRQTIVDLPEKDKKCLHDGHHLELISTSKTEKLEIIPAQFYINEIIENKYQCSHCNETYSPENNELGILPTTIASPSLLSHIVTSKYCDAIPLYRIVKIFSRVNINISRQTFARWIIEIGPQVTPVINLMRELLIYCGYLRIDETPVQVHNEIDRSAKSKSYMWIQNGKVDGENITIFDYYPSRSGTIPVELLVGFCGYLQADAYAGYNPVVSASNGKIIRLGCWDHCRRGFVDVYKIENGKGDSIVFILLIKKLYKIEEEIKAESVDVRYQVRQEKSVPVLKEFHSLIMKMQYAYPPKSKMGQAIQYAINQWPELLVYTQDGRLQISNILAENAIRPFAIGRKNWLFCDTPNGAHATAALYTLATTAMSNGISPGDYFTHLFRYLPHCSSAEDFESLLPLKSKFRKLANTR